MSGDDIVLRWPSWHEVRAFIRGVLGVRGAPDDGRAQRESEERRYNGVSRCC